MFCFVDFEKRTPEQESQEDFFAQVEQTNEAGTPYFLSVFRLP